MKWRVADLGLSQHRITKNRDSPPIPSERSGEGQLQVVVMPEVEYAIVIVEDHPVFREGLKTLFSSASDLKVIGEAENGAEGVERIRELEPDLAIMDLSLPQMSGIEAIAEVKRQCPGTRILAVTVHDDEEYIKTALSAGADGYVLKDADRGEILAAVRSVLSGRSYLSPGVSEKVIRGFLKGANTRDEIQIEDPLTPREVEVLKLIAEGHTNKAIAERLFLSVKTVERHRANIMAKLDLHNPQALTVHAIKRGLIAG